MTEIVNDYMNSYKAMDYEKMSTFWHPDFTFSDPAFPKLEGPHAKAMFHMFIINNATNKMTITVTSPAAPTSGADTYAISYDCDYLFGANGVPVHNEIRGVIELKDGKVWRHVDEFNLASWAKQSLGVVVATVLGTVGLLDRVVKKKGADKVNSWYEKNKQVLD